MCISAGRGERSRCGTAEIHTLEKSAKFIRELRQFVTVQPPNLQTSLMHISAWKGPQTLFMVDFISRY